MSHGQSPRPTGLLSRTAVSKDAPFGHGVSSRREADSSGGGSCRIGALEAGRRRTHATMGRLTTRTAANHLDHRPPQAIKRASPKNIATPQRQKRREKNVGFSEGRDGEGGGEPSGFGLAISCEKRRARDATCGSGCWVNRSKIVLASGLGKRVSRRSKLSQQGKSPCSSIRASPTACNASVVPMRMSA
jgi:hypothetical protein